MAKNIEMQYYDGSTYDICYPYTLWGNVYETYGGTTLATAITNINSQITTLNSQVGGFGSSISSINSSIQALDERVTVFEESMASKNATETITVSLKGSFNCSQNYWSPEPSISMNTASQNYSYCTLNLTHFCALVNKNLNHFLYFLNKNRETAHFSSILQKIL